MKARPGARIVLAATHVGEPTRDGRVVEVRGPDGGPPFVVEWSDGHTGLIFPGPGAVLRLSGDDEDDLEAVAAGAEPGTTDEAGPASTPTVTTGGSAADARASSSDAREWSVRIFIVESGDDTNAQAVLLADTPEHLEATGHSHRAHRDPTVPQIGDEVAVARALRHLADRLMAAAEDDIAAVTGEDPHVQRT